MSGGNICVRCGFVIVMLALLLPEMLIESLVLNVIVSAENKLMPLSVLMLPHLLNFRMFESGIDFDVLIEDCRPDQKMLNLTKKIQFQLIFSPPAIKLISCGFFRCRWQGE